MKDLIDKRNEREKIQRSIIKRWNVNYVQNQQPALGKEYVQNALSGTAPVSIQKEEEIHPEQELAVHREVNDISQGQIDKILHEKTDAIRNIVESGGKV